MPPRTATVPALSTLVVRAGLPLRVAAYNAIAEAIRAEAFPLGSPLPNEPDLGAMLGVSRTVVREALMLLEEDGLVRTRRGIGRFVADALPLVGLEQLRPLEVALAADGETVTVRRVRAETQRVSEFFRRGLGLDAEAEVCTWESVLERDGVAVALSLEAVPSGAALAAIDPRIALALLEQHAEEATLLGVLLEDVGAEFGVALGPGRIEIGVGSAGPRRGAHLRLDDDAAVTVLTQGVGYRGHPLYYAKHLIAPAAGALLVAQSAAS